MIYRNYFKIMINKKSTFLKLFNHIGEVHLFEYIINNMNKESFEWNCNSVSRKKASETIQLSEATIHRYLKNLGDYNILTNPHRGVYKVNRDHLNYID